MKTKIEYEVVHEWSSATVHRAKSGYVVTYNTRVQGQITGLKILVPYSEDFPRGVAMGRHWNDDYTYGDMLIILACQREDRRVLRRGIEVR